jgi:hypothetical protein
MGIEYIPFDAPIELEGEMLNETGDETEDETEDESQSESVGGFEIERFVGTGRYHEYKTFVTRRSGRLAQLPHVRFDLKPQPPSWETTTRLTRSRRLQPILKKHWSRY